MVRPQGLGSAVGMGGRLQRQSAWLSRRQGREWGLFDRVMRQPQPLWGQLMERKDPLHPPVVNGESVTGLDDPREFAGGEGVGKRQAHNLWLERDRHTSLDRHFAAWMVQCTAIESAHEACPLTAPQITPEAPRGEARRLAGLRESAGPLEDGPQHVVTCERLLRGCRVTHQEVKLRRGGGYRRQRVLPQSERLQ